MRESGASVQALQAIPVQGAEQSAAARQAHTDTGRAASRPRSLAVAKTLMTRVRRLLKPPPGTGKLALYLPTPASALKMAKDDVLWCLAPAARRGTGGDEPDRVTVKSRRAR